MAAVYPLAYIVFVVLLNVVLIDAQGLVDEGPQTQTLENIQEKAVRWLLEQRNADYGWDLGGTPRNIIAVASAHPEWPAKENLDARLTLKELEIELLHGLIRHNVEPITPGRIAYYSIALNAACKDPKNFHGHNLAGSLEKHTADQDYPGYPESFGFGLSSLVSCLSGSHLHKKLVRHLVNIVSDETSLDHVDTRSISAIALECYRRKRKNPNLARPIYTALNGIARHQEADGSFGSPHATFLALQALGVADQYNLSWNRSSAIEVLHGWQRQDGSFAGNQFSTAEGLLAVTSLLNHDGVLSLVRGKCASAVEKVVVESKSEKLSESVLLSSNTMTLGTLTKSATTKETTTMKTTTGLPASATAEVSPVGPGTGPKGMAVIRYWLWIGPDPVTAEKHSIEIQVPGNTTFFVAMRRAAELDPNYEFSATIWPNGHYVHTINGHREQPIGYHYWLLYKLTSDPDPLAPPPTTFVAPGGVDEINIEDGDVFLFWYKKL